MALRSRTAGDQGAFSLEDVERRLREEEQQKGAAGPRPAE